MNNLSFIYKLAGVTSIRVFGAFIGFLSTVLINRSLGIDNSGIYYVFVTTVTCLAVVFNFGVPSVIVRNVAYGENVLLSKSVAINLFISLISVYLLSYFIGDKLFELLSYDYLKDYRGEITTCVILTIINAYFASFCHGNGFIKSFSVVTTVCIPTTIALGLYLFDFDDIQSMINLYLFAVVVSSTFAIYSLRQYIRLSLTQNESRQTYFNGQFDFWVTNVFGVISSSGVIIVVSIYLSSSDVALISVSNRLVILVTFTMSALQVIVAPKLAGLYSKGNIKELVNYYKRTTLLMAIVSFPIVLFLFFWSEFALSIFGEDYVRGTVVLKILALAQFINVSCGSVWTLLNMTGNQKVVRNVVSITSILGLALCPLLSTRFGVEGAAVTILFTVMCSNLIPLYFANKRFKIYYG
ncbi:MATE family efflux transporter [Vibrio parahaemolyticus]